IVEKSGSWFSYKGERIGQGRENAKQFLKENKDIAAKIEAEVRKTLGLTGAQNEPAPPPAGPAERASAAAVARTAPGDGRGIAPVVAAARAMNAPRK
ncbi:MAG TPA: hypothetical protein VFU76_13820, partial [Terriglobales bacterium]|nr:hypothetical protein [Terriglobales bacterium]